MKKITELKNEELFHVASLINNNYIFNFNTFETVHDEDKIMLGANNCVWIILKHREGYLETIGHKTNIGWVDISLKMYHEVKGYLRDLDYVEEGYDPSTKISIDDSVKMLKIAMDELTDMPKRPKQEFLLDVVDNYKEQLNENYGK